MSVEHVGIGWPATSPKSWWPWPFWVVSIPPPLVSFPSRFLFSLDPMLGHQLPVSYDCLDQSVLQQIFANGFACGYWMPPAYNISPKGQTDLYYNTMHYEREYVVCHIGEIRVHWVRFLLLAPPVGYIHHLKCTAICHLVGAVIIEIWVNLPTNLWWFRWLIQTEHGGSQ